MAPITKSESVTASAGLISMASAGELLGQPHDNGKPWYTTMHRCG